MSKGSEKKNSRWYLSKMVYLSADENDPAEMVEPQKQSSSIGYRGWGADVQVEGWHQLGGERGQSLEAGQSGGFRGSDIGGSSIWQRKNKEISS